MYNAAADAANATLEQATNDAVNTYTTNVTNAVGTYNSTADALQTAYDSEIAAAEAAFAADTVNINSNLTTQTAAAEQSAITAFQTAQSAFNAAIAQINATYPAIAALASTSGSGSSSTSGSTSSSGSTSGSSSSSGSTSGSASSSGSSSSSGSGSGASSGTNSSYLSDLGVAQAVYLNGISSIDDSYKSGLISAYGIWETGSNNNFVAVRSAMDSAAQGFDTTVEDASDTFISGVLSTYSTYFGEIADAVTAYNQSTDDAYANWISTTIKAGKKYVSTVYGAWGTYQSTVVQAALNAKDSMEQAIFAYQDWYENEPYPHGYSGEDLDGDGIYEVPGGPDLASAKQHDLAVSIATINLDLQTKYANALYIYTVAEWDAWLTYFTDTTNADKNYSNAITDAESTYQIALDNANTTLDTTVISLKETYNKAKTNAEADLNIDMANASKDFLVSQLSTDTNYQIATNNAKLNWITGESNLWGQFQVAESDAWYQNQRDNLDPNSSDYATTYDHAGWETGYIDAGVNLNNSIQGIVTTFSNSLTSNIINAVSSLSVSSFNYTQSTTNANRNFDNGLTGAEGSLFGAIYSEDGTYANSITTAEANWSKAITSLKAGFQIGTANIAAVIGKKSAADARDATIQTAKDHLDTVTNDSSSPDYRLDGNYYSDAFDFVGEAYYYENGLYLDFGIPLGSIVVEVQEYVDALESGNIQNSGSTSGSSSSSGSTSTLTSGSGSGSASGSSSGSTSNLNSSSGSGSSSGSSSSSSSTSTSSTDEELIDGMTIHEFHDQVYFPVLETIQNLRNKLHAESNPDMQTYYKNSIEMYLGVADQMKAKIGGVISERNRIEWSTEIQNGTRKAWGHAEEVKQQFYTEVVTGGVPGISDARDLSEFLTMRDYVTNQPLTPIQYTYTTVGLVIPLFASGKLLRKLAGVDSDLASSTGKYADELDNVASKVEDVPTKNTPAGQFNNENIWIPPKPGTWMDKAWRAEMKDLQEAFDGTIRRIDKDPEINPLTGQPVYGKYDPVTNEIILYRGADDGTMFHELLHWQDFQTVIEQGIFTREEIANLAADALDRLVKSSEARVRKIQMGFGFTPAP